MENFILLGLLAAGATATMIKCFFARVAEHRRANVQAAELLRANRALRMASRCREALLHATSAEEMMAGVCRGLSDEGSYSLVWTGLSMAGSRKDLLASEIQGTPAGLFAAAAGGLQRGCSCQGIALEAMFDGKSQLCHGTPAEFGYPSALALPLAGANGDAAPMGVLCVYSIDPCAFEGDEVQVLLELATGLAHGLNTMYEARRCRAAEQALGCQARHEPATGLANRSLFNDRLRQALVAAKRTGRKVAVLALTMDRYRGVKASLGPEACNALLMHAASAMKSCLHEGDTVAHLLGNEFAVILSDMVHDDDVLAVAGKLLDAIKAPMRWKDNIVSTTASIGIALMGEEGGEPSVMLRSANSAMAHAVGHGGNRFRFVAQEMNERASCMFALEAELRRALVHNEMVVHYQPRAALSDGSLSAAEALVRWQHPTRGLVPPAAGLARSGAAHGADLNQPVGAPVPHRRPGGAY